MPRNCLSWSSVNVVSCASGNPPSRSRADVDEAAADREPGPSLHRVSPGKADPRALSLMSCGYIAAVPWEIEDFQVFTRRSTRRYPVECRFLSLPDSSPGQPELRRSEIDTARPATRSLAVLLLIASARTLSKSHCWGPPLFGTHFGSVWGGGET